VSHFSKIDKSRKNIIKCVRPPQRIKFNIKIVYNMGGNTGNIRTPRLSASSGTRNIFSMISNNDSGAGCGSSRRIYKYWKCYLGDEADFFKRFYGLEPGQFIERNQYALNAFASRY
jgi:hypothetical protein